MGAGQFVLPIINDHDFRGHMGSLRHRGEVVCDFEADEIWSAGVADTVNFISGTQGLSLTANASDYIAAQLNKDLNLYDKDLGIWAYCADRTNLSKIYLYFSMGDITYYNHVYVEIPLTNDGWNYVTVSSFDYAFVRCVYEDLKNVKSMRVRVSAVSTGSVTVTVDKLMAFNKVLSKGTILFTFDDGNKSVYENAKPCLDKYNYPATVFAITSYIENNPAYMSLNQLKTLRDLNWIIASHTHTHPNLTECIEADIITELTTSQNYLKDNGFSPGHKYLAYPHGAHNALVDELTKKYYQLGFTIKNREFHGLALRDRANVPRRLIKNASYTVAQVKEQLDFLVERKSVLTVFLHSVGVGGDFTTEEFSEIVDYVNALNLNVLTVDDLAQIYGLAY